MFCKVFCDLRPPSTIWINGRRCDPWIRIILSIFELVAIIRFVNVWVGGEMLRTSRKTDRMFCPTISSPFIDSRMAFWFAGKFDIKVCKFVTNLINCPCSVISNSELICSCPNFCLYDWIFLNSRSIPNRLHSFACFVANQANPCWLYRAFRSKTSAFIVFHSIICVILVFHSFVFFVNITTCLSQITAWSVCASTLVFTCIPAYLIIVPSLLPWLKRFEGESYVLIFNVTTIQSWSCIGSCCLAEHSNGSWFASRWWGWRRQGL